MRGDDENIRTKVLATEPGSALRATSKVELSRHGLGGSVSDHDSATASRAQSAHAANNLLESYSDA